MAKLKVFPQKHTTNYSPFMSLKRETLTIWMKSLLCHSSYGCTVFNSNGDIVYRIDNYDKRCSSEVFLMDLQGKVLFTIKRKRLQILGCWYGYRRDVCDIKKEKPWFRVKKCYCNICRGNINVACQVVAGHEKYLVVKLAHKTAFRIVDIEGDIVAEVKQKQISSSGIKLGEDVLTMIVEPQRDHSLVMAIVTVYELINNKL